MGLCDYYYGKVFGHLAAALGIASVSAEYSDVGQILMIPGSPFISILLSLGITILAVLGVLWTEPGGVMKYIFFVAFAILIGQTLKPIIQKLEDNHRLVHILLLTTGICLGMMAVGFYDEQNLLGIGHYLLVGLIGLIIVELCWYFMSPPERRKQVGQWIDTFGAALFALFIAYDTQRIKENARTCKTYLNQGKQPDYPADSIGLFLDIVNLFSSLGRSNN